MSSGRSSLAETFLNQQHGMICSNFINYTQNYNNEALVGKFAFQHKHNASLFSFDLCSGVVECIN